MVACWRESRSRSGGSFGKAYAVTLSLLSPRHEHLDEDFRTYSLLCMHGMFDHILPDRSERSRIVILMSPYMSLVGPRLTIRYPITLTHHPDLSVSC
jgi:hypothetical protein